MINPSTTLQRLSAVVFLGADKHPLRSEVPAGQLERGGRVNHFYTESRAKNIKLKISSNSEKLDLIFQKTTSNFSPNRQYLKKHQKRGKEKKKKKFFKFPVCIIGIIYQYHTNTITITKKQ